MRTNPQQAMWKKVHLFCSVVHWTEPT
uniref:Uncharacterized protein n=1 Tax=Anguilla anguilla TaxID=7936 RepID=A0A0E9RG90_ANGAN